MRKIIAYCKIECPHSNNTKETLIDLKNNYNINVEINTVSEDEKHDIIKKTSNITNNYKTFPIIIYQDSMDKMSFFGGNSDLQNLLKNMSNLKNYYEKLSTDAKKLAAYLYRNIT